MAMTRDDRASEQGERPISDPLQPPTALPYAKAFVVQFVSETESHLGNARGRVEHLQTGRRSRFSSIEELVTRIRAMLAGLEASRDATRTSQEAVGSPRTADEGGPRLGSS
jgi:hypothetical protein